MIYVRALVDVHVDVREGVSVRVHLHVYVYPCTPAVKKEKS
jgi:hypothetical protein